MNMSDRELKELQEWLERTCPPVDYDIQVFEDIQNLRDTHRKILNLVELGNKKLMKDSKKFQSEEELKEKEEKKEFAEKFKKAIIQNIKDSEVDENIEERTEIIKRLEAVELDEKFEEHIKSILNMTEENDAVKKFWEKYRRYQYNIGWEYYENRCWYDNGLDEELNIHEMIVGAINYSWVVLIYTLIEKELYRICVRRGMNKDPDRDVVNRCVNYMKSDRNINLDKKLGAFLTKEICHIRNAIAHDNGVLSDEEPDRKDAIIRIKEKNIGCEINNMGAIIVKKEFIEYCLKNSEDIFRLFEHQKQ